MPDALSSWTDGATKAAIVAFVDSITKPGPDFVPEAERIAAFDNDGTLWCEKPTYVQADFVLRKWAAMVRAEPALADHQPFTAVAGEDREWLASLLDHVPDLVRGVGEAFGGITPDAFAQEVDDFFGSAHNPILNVPYTAVTYRPMRDLVTFLELNGFRVFICSAGGRDFVRAIVEEVYDLDRERVIGTGSPLEFKDGVLLRMPGFEQPIDDGPGKPVHIWASTGRAPLFAAGNADGDVEMLSLARFGLLVHHDDDVREFAYDKGAEWALAQAQEHGWTVASMKRDFVEVFSAEAGSRPSGADNLDR